MTQFNDTTFAAQEAASGQRREISKKESDAIAESAAKTREAGLQGEARYRQQLAAEMDVEAGAARDASSQPSLRIVGNLPYNISTPLLFHLLALADRVVDQHFMLQKEVVARMVAAPGTADFGRLSVMLQVRYDMESLFDVPPTAFDPPPKVTSAIVRMIPLPRSALEIRDATRFARLVMTAFGQRRKMLRNTLADHAEAMEALGIAATARAEEIGPRTWVALSNWSAG